MTDTNTDTNAAAQTDAPDDLVTLAEAAVHLDGLVRALGALTRSGNGFIADYALDELERCVHTEIRLKRSARNLRQMRK